MYGSMGIFIIFLTILFNCFNPIRSITINDGQNQNCLPSNYCARDLTLKCNQRNRNNNPLQFTEQSGWDSVCGNGLLGDRGANIDLTIEGNNQQRFEVRLICLEITSVRRVDWSFILPEGGFESDTAVTKTEKHEFCVKKEDDDHRVIESVTLTVVPQTGARARVSLKFQACGDKNGLGSVNTSPDDDNTKLTVQNLPKGREECFDQYTLDYSNRNTGIIKFKDDAPGNKEMNALHGSGNVFTKAAGENVLFEVSVDRSPKEFVLWRACFLVRNAKSMTFRMFGETDTWTQTIDICEPENYVWKCYNPWRKFLEINRLEIELEAGSGQSEISVQKLSVAVCTDNEFGGDIVRIGSATSKCRIISINRTDICTEKVSIRKADRKDFQSEFDFSHDVKKKNTSIAWQLLAPENEAYESAPGTKSAPFIYSLRKPCSKLGDMRFQARAIQFWGQNIQRVVAKFCDVDHPLDNKPLHCNQDKNGFTIWDDPSSGLVVNNNPKDPSVGSKFIINNWHVVTAVQLVFVAADSSKSMKIWNFNLIGCCDPSKNKRNLRPPPPAKDTTPVKVTNDQCANLYELRHPVKKNVLGAGLFNLDDRDDDRDENLALFGSDDTYVGETDKNIFFYITLNNAQNYELWEICVGTLNINRVTYIMETSTVTFIESKTICGIDVQQRKCYIPKNRGLIVKKTAIKFEVEPGREGRITGLKLDACRDHYSYNYTLNTHPCDFKSLSFETPRNQKITVHALKDSDGKWLQTQLYHITDRTGNDGDNTWFMLQPQHHLVSAIWTKNTYMDLSWDIVNNKVTFEIYLTGQSKIHTRVTVLDLKDLKKLTEEEFETESPQVEQDSLKHCNIFPFTLRRCGLNLKSVRLTASVKAREKFSVPSYFDKDTGKNRFILPKDKFDKPAIKDICSSVSTVFEAECERHRVFKRGQHQFICASMRRVVSSYDTVTNSELSQMYQSCLFTYKALRWTCAVMADRPRNDMPLFFTSACRKKTNFETKGINKKLGSSTTEVQIKGVDAFDKKFTAPKINKGSLSTAKFSEEKLNVEQFIITGITTKPAKIPEVHSYNYTVCIQYQCANGDKSEELHVMPRLDENQVSSVTVCKDLLKDDCCVEMPCRMKKKILHSVMLMYFPDGKTKELQQEEIVVIS